MDERDGFYFHRSFWESIELMNAKDQLALFKAITEFALNGHEPEKLTSNQKASWVLIRPVLAKGRNKATNGKKGGSKKKANGKQNESKLESASGLPLSDKGLGSNSNELRQGTRDEGNKDPTPNDGALFTVFWNAYPECARRKRESAWEAWKKLNPGQKDFEIIMQRLEDWKQSKQWQDDNGAFIPNAENFLDPQRNYLFTTPAPAKQPVPKGASGELGAAELEAIQQLLNRRIEDLPCEEVEL